MPYQNIDASISAVDLQAIKDAFATIKQKLPFLVSLTVDERKSTFKAGPNSLSFVQNALSAAEGHPDIFPNSFSTTAFRKDVDLFSVLTELGTSAESLSSQIDDTRLTVGGEAMQHCTQDYTYGKESAKTSPDLK